MQEDPPEETPELPSEEQELPRPCLGAEEVGIGEEEADSAPFRGTGAACFRLQNLSTDVAVYYQVICVSNLYDFRNLIVIILLLYYLIYVDKFSYKNIRNNIQT